MLLEHQKLVCACRVSFFVSIGLFILVVLLVLLTPIILSGRLVYLSNMLKDPLHIYIIALGLLAFFLVYYLLYLFVLF